MFINDEMREDWEKNREELIAFWKSGQYTDFETFPDSKPCYSRAVMKMNCHGRRCISISDLVLIELRGLSPLEQITQAEERDLKKCYSRRNDQQPKTRAIDDQD